MKRLILILLLYLISVDFTYAQVSALGHDVKYTIELLDTHQIKEAYSHWSSREVTHRNDSLYAWANATLAEIFMQVGAIHEGESLIHHALDAINKIKSNDSWWWQQWGYISTRAGRLYLQTHDNTRAHKHAVEAKNAYEHALFRGIDYAIALSILAETAQLRGNYVLARTFSSSSLIWAGLAYSEQPSNDMLHALFYVARENACMEYKLGYYKEAITTFENIRNLCQQLQIQNSHIDLYLGSAYANSGDYAQAIKYLEPYYKSATAPFNLITSGTNLLWAKHEVGDTDIYNLAYDIAKIQSDNISRMFSFMSNSEREQWWMSSNENEIINFVDYVLLKSGLKDANEIVTNNEIFTKGLLLRSANELKNAAQNSNDERIIAKYNTLESLKQKWSNISDKEQISELENQISKLEKELLSELNINSDEIASCQEIASSLAPNEIAIEFIRLANITKPEDSEYYAIILKNGDKTPEIKYLFNETSLKNLIDNSTEKNLFKYIDNLYTTGKENHKGDELYKLIWSKLEKEVKGYERIYYSLSGRLNSIAVQALSKGKYTLGELFEMRLVSSISNIPHIKNQTHQLGKLAVVYGGIQYTVDEEDMIQAADSYTHEASSTWDISTIETRAGVKQLDGAEEEAHTIRSLLVENNINVDFYTGINANEESFKMLSGKGIQTIHIATHGFFLSDPDRIKKNGFLNPMMSDRVGTIDPMERSGLLFSGANRVWTGKRAIKGIEDGILTAKEISVLDFSGLELLVLSACQTGLGDIKANEGVYGLQRAFKLAGAETIIMTLWEVHDTATKVMMETFYQKYVETNRKDVAFNYAINAVKNYEEGGKKIFNSPFYWAGFIMID
jgi:CHAT domain-containing protein